MKRTPLRPGGPLQRHKRLNPRSHKARQVADERGGLLTLLRRLRGPLCEVPDCGRFAEHAHEPLTRARGGSVLDPANILLLCPQCHRYIHEHPNWSAERGYLRHSWEK